MEFNKLSVFCPLQQDIKCKHWREVDLLPNVHLFIFRVFRLSVCHLPVLTRIPRILALGRKYLSGQFTYDVRHKTLASNIISHLSITTKRAQMRIICSNIIIGVGRGESSRNSGTSRGGSSSALNPSHSPFDCSVGST